MRSETFSRASTGIPGPLSSTVIRHGADAGEATATLDPQTLNQLPDALRDGVVAAYADALAPKNGRTRTR
jgi:hypothetical protein